MLQYECHSVHIISHYNNVSDQDSYKTYKPRYVDKNACVDGPVAYFEVISGSMHEHPDKNSSVDTVGA